MINISNSFKNSFKGASSTQVSDINGATNNVGIITKTLSLRNIDYDSAGINDLSSPRFYKKGLLIFNFNLKHKKITEPIIISIPRYLATCLRFNIKKVFNQFGSI
jgi:hypothetical protein